MSARVPLRAGRATHGTVALEYAFVMPALLLLTIGIMDTGRLLWSKTALDRAVESAARCRAVAAPACATTGLIQSYAVSHAAGLNIAPTAFSVSTPACGVQVSASFAVPLVIPWTASDSIMLSATACYPA